MFILENPVGACGSGQAYALLMRVLVPSILGETAISPRYFVQLRELTTWRLFQPRCGARDGTDVDGDNAYQKAAALSFSRTLALG